MKKPPFLRTPYNYDTNAASDETALDKFEPTRTQQHFKEEADINFLVQRYVVPEAMPRHDLPPLEGEIFAAPSLQDALNVMVRAREAFMTLPANVRSRFNHNPAEFVAFTSDEGNRDDLRKMGLWSPEAVQAWEKEAADRIAAAERNKADAERYRAATKDKVEPQKGTT